MNEPLKTSRCEKTVKKLSLGIKTESDQVLKETQFQEKLPCTWPKITIVKVNGFDIYSYFCSI